jgi:hypothetical protein
MKECRTAVNVKCFASLDLPFSGNDTMRRGVLRCSHRRIISNFS